MAPLIPSAKSTLSYPLYACDFDPINPSRLVVGGGGGAGRTGVGNKITLLDTSNPNELVEAAEIDLSKEEDNVTSLAVGQPQGKTSLIYAGVNSSPEELGKGINAHFRVIGIEPVATGEGKGKITQSVATTSKLSEISRISLFTHVERDLYQRVTRLSRPYLGQSQWGAVATGLAKDSEIVLFETARTGPPTSKGAIKLAKEAVDMDFIQTGKDDYLFAYADDHDIYVRKLGSIDDGAESECVYITPASRGKEKVTLPSFRSIRWLTKDFIVMLTNIHSQGGVVVQILRLPPSGKGQCRIAQSHRLPSSITKATGLAVSNLTPPVAPDEEQDYTQFVIAVAGHDISISLFKVDLQHELNNYLVTPIKPFRTFKNVHPLQITGITFSNFTPPTGPITASTPPQYLKLASVGVSNTVIVHTLPLFPVPLSVKRGQSHTPRYVVALPSSKAIYSFGIILSMLLAVFVAIMMQSILEIRGVVEPHLGAANYLPIPLQEALGKPYRFPSNYNTLNTQSSTPPISPNSPETSPSPRLLRLSPIPRPKLPSL
ncbi:eaf0bf0a-5e41-441a-8257-3e4c6eaea4bb [Sclerotinia trifoliorum]|uniref:Guanine nucleotide-exchange factor SEC12 n=1 Tax=Sclerotinia trifoliorum TaxID=28548 RepID=A0A8H2ZLH3_9HELO|nr:eaf0bf0a-5e41-441a-8257-3e4c6eaea4bb [Sclerotinia trifoliorum]